jgi:hypothetical protein
MTPSKLKQHKPTAISRKMTEKITEPGKEAGSTPKKQRKSKEKWNGERDCWCRKNR